MLSSNTSGPNGAFVAFLKESAPVKDRVDWPALDRDIAGRRDAYHDLWQGGILSGGELADAVALFHNLPRRGPTSSIPGELFNASPDGSARAWIFRLTRARWRSPGQTPPR